MSGFAPKRIHKAGFHPDGREFCYNDRGWPVDSQAALNFKKNDFVNALGIAGSMASGIIEYLAEGAWTKRLHPGWAAQSGMRAADLARAGFSGPRTVFEGTHGLYQAFAHTAEGDWGKLLDGFGERWLAASIAFKPYACGTMTQPYIDCARRLAKNPHRRDRRGRVRGRQKNGAPAVGAARGQAASAQRLRREVQPRPTASPPASSSAMPASRRSPRNGSATRACSRSPPRCAT